MLNLTGKNKKIAIISAVILLTLAIILASYLISKRNTDERGKAATLPQALLSFDQAQYPLPSVGAEVRANVMIEVPAGSNVSAGAITVSYPTNVLNLNLAKTEQQAANAGTTCNLLDQTLSFDGSQAGTIKMVKASYKAEASLPTGKFCYGSMFFTVKSTDASSNPKLGFGGNPSTLADWDIVGKSGRYQPVLSVPVPVGSNTGTTPTVSVSFDKPSLQLGAVGSEIKANIMFSSSSPVVGGGVTIGYPTNILEFEQAKVADQATNADAACKALDQVLYATSDPATGIAKLIKITYKPEAQLPSGIFCQGTLFFKVKNSSPTSSDTIKFAGDISNVKDWDIVTKAGRAAPSLGSPITLSGAGSTTTPTVSRPPTSTTPTSTHIPTVTTTSSPSPTATKTPTPTTSPSPSSTITIEPTTTTIPTIDPQCPRKQDGDANCDGKVNLQDFEIFRNEFISFQRGTLDVSTAVSDFNGDQRVDLEDFAAFRETYLRENFSPTATPSV